MGVNEEKIALIVEAVNRFKGTFDELANSLKGVDDQHTRTGQKSESMFSKLKKNWLEISVVAYEAAKAVQEAWEYMEGGAKAQQAEESFRAVAAAAGESADEIIEAMKRASAGAVDDSDIMQKAVKGMMQGLSGDQMISIMSAARTAARVTGQEVGQAYETITDAIANKAPRALLQYGLITKEQMKMLNEAMAMGITEVDIYAIAMENAATQTGKLNIEGENNIEKMQRWKALFNEIKESIGKGIFWIMDNVIDPLVSMIEKAGAMIGHTFSTIGAIWGWLTSGFKGGTAALGKEFKDLDDALRESFQDIDAKHGKKPRSSPGTSAGSPAPASGSSATQQLKDIHAMKAREAAIQRELTMLDVSEKNRDISHLDAARERVRLEEKLLETQKANLAPINDPNAKAAKQKEIDETIRKINELKLALRELDGDFQAGFKEGLLRYIDAVGGAFKQAVELAQATAQAMQQAFSDFFFDIMTNKLKNFSDYIKGFLESIARAIANMMAQQAAAGIASGIAGMFSGGGGAGTGEVQFHQGGLVMHRGGYVPRFHFGGLMPDERPAILQTGEGVLSRRGMAALDALNGGQAGGGGTNVTVEVVNKSSQAVKATQGPMKFDLRGAVVSVILEDLEGNGPLRQAGVGGAR